MTDHTDAEAPVNQIESDSNSAPQFLWGVRAISKAIGRSERATFHLLERRQLKCAHKVGHRWVVDRDSLAAELRGEAAVQARERSRASAA
jgi:hypothetical protein